MQMLRQLDCRMLWRLLLEHVYNLLRQAKAKAKQAHYGSVWVWMNRVIVRKFKGEPIIYIDTEDDLAKLI